MRRFSSIFFLFLFACFVEREMAWAESEWGQSSILSFFPTRKWPFLWTINVTKIGEMRNPPSLSLSLSLWRLKGSELMRLYLPFFMGQTELKDGWIMDASHCRYVCRYNGPDWLSTADADDDDDMTYKWSTLSFCPYIISIHVTLFSLILLFFSLAPKCHSLLLLYLIGKLSCCCYCWVNNTPAFRRRFKGASNTHR